MVLIRHFTKDPIQPQCSSALRKTEMALLLTSNPSLLCKRPKTLRLYSLRSPNPSLCFSLFSKNPRFSSFPLHSSFSGDSGEPDSFSDRFSINKPPKKKDSDERYATESSDGVSPGITDEWGEKAEPEAETSYTKLSDADPPKDEDEWGGGEGSNDYMSGNGNVSVYDKLGDLKRCLVDSVYGTDLGFRASAEVRAEVLELVNQLESSNPTLAPVEAPALLDGNWILLYTAFSELLPLLAAGMTPFLKIKRICQTIDTKYLTIDNSTTLSSAFATFSFSASSTFEVRSPTRIQVQFNEGILQPPEIKSSLDLPGNVEVFGQTINLSPVQQSLNPLQEVVASISRAISGQPPLKVPIPGDSSRSWLLITYLDEDLRISRGDGGLFVLAKEGSPLLDQWP